MSVDLVEIIRRWPPHAIAYLCEDPKVCEDCGNGTDLGHKCRACYAQWRRLVWQDIQRAHGELVLVAKQLNIIGDGERRLIADVALGKTTGRISGRSADLFLIVKRVLDGPYGPQLTMKLQAIVNVESDGKKGRKPSSKEID